MSQFLEIVYQRCVLGEGPHWDAARQQLFFVDIVAQNFLKFNPATRRTTKVDLDKQIGFAVPVEGSPEKFIVGQGRDITLLEWDGESQNPTSTRVLHTVDAQYPGNRLNDGKCDTQGRLWAGTMVENGEPENSGSLYELDLNGSVQKLFGGVGTSNGLAWNSTDTMMYYNDTNTRKVDRFAFNSENGTISGRTTVFDLAAAGLRGSPDGMTIDANGNLWVCLWDGYKVIQVDPNVGRVIGEINMPVKDITSAAFGGPNLNELYVTCASFHEEPNAGSLWRVTNLGGNIRGRAGGNSYKGLIPNN